MGESFSMNDKNEVSKLIKVGKTDFAFFSECFALADFQIETPHFSG